VTSVGDANGSGDWATGIVFPIGRFFSTIAQGFAGSFRSGEYSEALAAFGHYSEFWTHSLTNTNPAATDAETLSSMDPDKECKSLHDFDEKYRPDGYLTRGWTRTYSNVAQLRALNESKSDPNNPYWVQFAFPDDPLWFGHRPLI
jgi:hypothetical protein